MFDFWAWLKCVFICWGHDWKYDYEISGFSELTSWITCKRCGRHIVYS
jgi:hypothetical protein